MKQAELATQISSTYFSLRAGMARFAILFPPLIIGAGLVLYGRPIRDSISEYYFAFPPEFPARPLFVGILFAIGSFLWMYKGSSKIENLLLNVAGVSALGVALFPMSLPQFCGDKCGSYSFSWLHYYSFSWLHYAFTFILFGCMAFVIFVCTEATLKELEDEKKREYYRNRYNLFTILIIAAPCAAILFGMTGAYSWKIGAEAAGIWVFGFYWFMKTSELRAIKEETEKATELRALKDAAIKDELEKKTSELSALKGELEKKTSELRALKEEIEKSSDQGEGGGLKRFELYGFALDQFAALRAASDTAPARPLEAGVSAESLDKGNYSTQKKAEAEVETEENATWRTGWLTRLDGLITTVERFLPTNKNKSEQTGLRLNASARVDENRS